MNNYSQSDYLLKNLREYVISHYNCGSFREILRSAPKGFIPKNDDKAMKVIQDAYILYKNLQTK